MAAGGAADDALRGLMQAAPPLQRVRDDVVDASLRELYARHPEWIARWGAPGVDATRRDLHHHLDFLGASIDLELPEVFLQYAAWLGVVLSSRHVPWRAAEESFTVLAERLEAALPPPEAKPFVALLRRATHERPEDRALPPPPRTPEGLDLPEALLRGEATHAEMLLVQALQDGRPYPELMDAMVSPAMAEVGERWQTNRITVAQEHLASAVLQTALARAAAVVPPDPPQRRRASFACVEGNFHAIGLRLVADSFQLAGWDVRYLGADVPTRDLLRHVHDAKPDLLGLSLSMPWHVAAARNVISATRREMGPASPRMLVGGVPFHRFPSTWKQTGADAWSPDVRSAMAEALRHPREA